jgi:hypothetical protein
MRRVVNVASWLSLAVMAFLIFAIAHGSLFSHTYFIHGTEHIVTQREGSLLIYSWGVPSNQPLRTDGSSTIINLWGAVVVASCLPLWRLIAWQRARHAPWNGLCKKCGYNLTGNVSGVCPECGNPIKSFIAGREAFLTLKLSRRWQPYHDVAHGSALKMKRSNICMKAVLQPATW